MTIDWQARALKAEADAKALLDERDAQNGAISTLSHTLSEQQQRIHELENAAFGADGSLSMNMAVASIRAAESKASDRLRGQLQTVEAERDHLAVELAQVTQCRDEYGNEIDVVNTRWERAEAERDKLAAERDEAAQLSHEFRNERDREKTRAERAEEQLQAIREVVTGWNGFTGLTREVLAILADTDEGDEQ